MNVLYFVNRFPKLSESFVINEIYELENLGHNIAVFSLRKPEISMSHDEVADLDVEVGYLPDPGLRSALTVPGAWCLDRDVLESIVHRSNLVTHAGSAYIAGHCIQFVKSLDFDIDHIHGHFLNWPKLAAQYTAKRLDVPQTVTAHAYGMYSDPDVRMLRRLANRSNRVITISEYNREYLKKNINVDSPVDVVHMGIDPEKFQPTDTAIKNRILTVGRFVEKKGISYAIEAIAQSVEEIPDIEYHIVGSGPEEDKIRRLIAKHDLEDTVEILGNVTDEELIREYDESEVFLLPCVIAENGDRDGIPVVLMEAMAMRTVPISTTLSGIPELIKDGVHGLLVEPEEINRLSETISLVLNERDSQNLSEAARERVLSEFSITHQTEGTIEAFRRITEPESLS